MSDADDYINALPCRCGGTEISLGIRMSPEPYLSTFYAVCDACGAVGDEARTERDAAASWNAAVADRERMLAVDMSAGAPMIHYAPAATPAQRKRIAVHAQLYRRYVAGRDGGSA